MRCMKNTEKAKAKQMTKIPKFDIFESDDHNQINLEIIEEQDDYEFDPAEANDRLKRRMDKHVQRFRAAQERQDNYYIEYYKIMIQIDKLDQSKLKLKSQLYKLKQSK